MGKGARRADGSSYEFDCGTHGAPLGGDAYINTIKNLGGDVENPFTFFPEVKELHDRRLAELPEIGLVKFRDAETGEEMYIDTSSSKVQEAQRQWWNEQCKKRDDVLKKSRVDSVSISTEQDYVKALLNLFAKRS